MNIEALRADLNHTIALCEEIQSFSKPTSRFARSLGDFISQAYERVTSADHGERDRFYVPHSDAVMKLQELLGVDPKKLNSAFATHKAKLLSILNQYIKGLQRGFQQYDLESGPTPLGK